MRLAMSARFGDTSGDAVFGLLEAELLQQRAKLLAIPGGVERFDRGAENRNAGFLQSLGEIQRRLAAELDDDAFDEAASRQQ